MVSSLSKNALQILKERYLLTDSDGTIIETPYQLFKRVATFVASCEGEKKAIFEEQFYEILRKLYFLPNSPTLMNAGMNKGQLSACFVLPIRDSLEDITREERDDVFEMDIDDKEKPNDSIGDPLPETEVEEIISEPITPSISMPTKNNTNDIIIAGIIIIFVIKFID